MHTARHHSSPWVIHLPATPALSCSPAYMRNIFIFSYWNAPIYTVYLFICLLLLLLLVFISFLLNSSREIVHNSWVCANMCVYVLLDGRQCSAQVLKSIAISYVRAECGEGGVDITLICNWLASSDCWNCLEVAWG